MAIDVAELREAVGAARLLDACDAVDECLRVLEARRDDVLAVRVDVSEGLDPRNRPGQAALKSALRIRLLLSAVLAGLAAAWVARKS